MGAQASSAELTATQAGSCPCNTRNTNAPNRITITAAIRWLIGRDVVVARR